MQTIKQTRLNWLRLGIWSVGVGLLLSIAVVYS